jgi:hypothetical protein
MLTRAQVARRLGKSIATVRRLEGDQLHPRRDDAGVYRFDSAEVDRLAAHLRVGRRQNTSDIAFGAARSECEHPQVRANYAAYSAASLPAGSVEDASTRPVQHDDPPLQSMRWNGLAARVAELEKRLPAHER